MPSTGEKKIFKSVKKTLFFFKYFFPKNKIKFFLAEMIIMTDYIKRNDNKGKIITEGRAENGGIIKDIPLYTILDTGYKYILEEMIKENFFILQDRSYAAVKEIVHDQKVVGFAAYDYTPNMLILEEIYILPEYRGKNIIIDELEDTLNLFQNIIKLIMINLPNQYVIKSLVKNKLAHYINDYLILSNVPFCFTIKEEDELTEADRNTLPEDLNPVGMKINSFIYDTRISAIVCPPLQLLSPVLDIDIRDFNALENRMKIVNNKYFQNICKELKDNNVDEMHWKKN